MAQQMTLHAAEEFRIRATPDQELLRRLAYLSAQGSESVLTGLNSADASYRSSGRDQTRRATDAWLQMARLNDPVYQAMSARINEDFDRMDEASVLALQEIEQELLDLQRERERVLEHAYRDEQGRAIFMTQDERAAYYQDGLKLSEDEFAAMRDRLRGRPSWESWQGASDRREQLFAERDQIHAHEASRSELRDELARGSVSAEEAEIRAQEIADAMPERVRRKFESLPGYAAEAGPAPAPLSDRELAELTAAAVPAEPAGNLAHEDIRPNEASSRLFGPSPI